MQSDEKNVQTCSQGADADVMVSIICITFNHAPFLHKALDGFLMQRTNFRFEVLLHDDASTDGTAEIVKAYAKKYPDIIVPILEKENQYSQHIDFSQKMYAMARGKYFAFCEGDDYWIDADKLQKQFDYMEAHPDCSICGHNSFILDDRERDHPHLKETVTEDYAESTFTMEDLLRDHLIDHGLYPMASVFMRRECVPHYPWLRRFSFGDLFMVLTPFRYGYGYRSNAKMAVYRVNNPGSYNEVRNQLPHHERIQKWINFRFEFLEGLEYFNRETEYRWDSLIQELKEKIKYQRLPMMYLEYSSTRMCLPLLWLNSVLLAHPRLKNIMGRICRKSAVLNRLKSFIKRHLIKS